MFDSLEDDIKKVDQEPTDRQQQLVRTLGFLAVVCGITILVLGGLWAAIRFME